jgi:Protein of unknown function (DUF3500)
MSPPRNIPNSCSECWRAEGNHCAKNSVLIEFDHQPGIVYANNEPTRDHIHTVVRTPNGNDYGKDLLRQHYAQRDHSHPWSAHLLGKV